jgi:hypothetical protein
LVIWLNILIWIFQILAPLWKLPFLFLLIISSTWIVFEIVVPIVFQCIKIIFFLFLKIYFWHQHKTIQNHKKVISKKNLKNLKTKTKTKHLFFFSMFFFPCRPGILPNINYELGLIPVKFTMQTMFGYQPVLEVFFFFLIFIINIIIKPV